MATKQAEQIELQPAKKEPSSAMVTVQPDSMLMVIERVLHTPDFDVNKLEALLKLRREYEADEAKKAYVAAKARFGQLGVTVTKDRTNKQYDSKYTSIGNLVNTVRPHLAACGLEPSWQIEQADSRITVTCTLTHEFGHSGQAKINVAPDTSGQKNPLQQIKSAITYARILTFECVCGLASTDGIVNVDDDGNGSGKNGVGHISDEQFVQLMDGIENAGNLDELKRLYFSAIEQVKNDASAKDQFSKAKNRRYRELSHQ